MRISSGISLFGAALSLAILSGAGCSGGQLVPPPEGVGGSPDFSTGDGPPFPNDTTVVSTGFFPFPEGLWINPYGDAEDQTMSAFAANDAGECALVGTVKGTINFGNIPWTGSTTDTDVVVARTSKEGQALWSRRYGDSCDQRGGAVALSPSGNVLLAGDFCGKMDFGTTTVETKGTEVDAFVAMIDTLGEDIYSRSFGGKGAQVARAAAVDADGNAVIVGSFDQAFDDGTGEVAGVGKDDIFVLKLDPGGKVLWSQRFGGPEADIPRAVVVDANGNITFAGSFGGTVDFGGGPLMALSDHPSAFVIKLDASGKYLWGQTFASDDAVVNGLAPGPDGVVAVAGSLAGSIDFGSGPMMTAGGDDAFVAEIDSAGKISWGRAYGGPGSDRATAVAFGVNGDIAVTGTADEVVQFGNIGLGAFLSEGPEMVYMAQLDSAGIANGSWAVGSSAPLKSVGIAFFGNHDATLAGSFQATMSGGGFKPTQPAGGWDMFLLHQP
jgi:hypothetical protein